MGKRKEARIAKAKEKQAKREAEKKETPVTTVPVTTPTTTPTTTPPVTNPEPYKDKTGLTTVFCYGTLNVHDVQRDIWGEAKEGVTGTLVDYELKRWGKGCVMYVEKKLGERVVGKAYDLTKEQVEATDEFESELYIRETIYKSGESFDVYVRNPKFPAITSVNVN